LPIAQFSIFKEYNTTILINRNILKKEDQRIVIQLLDKYQITHRFVTEEDAAHKMQSCSDPSVVLNYTVLTEEGSPTSSALKASHIYAVRYLHEQEKYAVCGDSPPNRFLFFTNKMRIRTKKAVLFTRFACLVLVI
jgi:hypothetical protein